MNDIYGSTFHGFKSYVITAESIGTEIACSRGNFDRLVIEFFVQHFLFRFGSSLRIALYFVSFYILGTYMTFLFYLLLLHLHALLCIRLCIDTHIMLNILKNLYRRTFLREKNRFFYQKNLILNINERRSLYSVIKRKLTEYDVILRLFVLNVSQSIFTYYCLVSKLDNANSIK